MDRTNRPGRSSRVPKNGLRSPVILLLAVSSMLCFAAAARSMDDFDAPDDVYDEDARLQAEPLEAEPLEAEPWTGQRIDDTNTGDFAQPDDFAEPAMEPVEADDPFVAAESGEEPAA
ncbi:MAG: hypothetical protein ACREQQ_01315, partial [Candidatus Binatia bacterium]